VAGLVNDEESDRLASTVRELLSKQYGESFEYRFMEAFRNHVQHSGLPTHSIQFGSTWTPEFERKWQENYVLAFATRSLLAEDKKFKKAVLDETPDRVDLVHATRHYLERLGTVHKEVREMASPHTNRARETVRGLIDRYAGLHPGKPIGLAAHRVGENGDEEFVPLLLDWDDIRLYLIERNETLPNLSKRTVSGRTNF